MKCYNCGGELGPVKLVDLPYRSLPGVVLHGIQAQECPTCGDAEYEIPDLDGLNAALSDVLVRKEGRLSGPEVRFLRKRLGWSSQDFARRVGVTPETVSRWENGRIPIGETPDKLLRMFVIHEQPVQQYPLESFDQLAKLESPPLRIEVESDRGWRARAA